MSHNRMDSGGLMVMLTVGIVSLLCVIVWAWQSHRKCSQQKKTAHHLMEVEFEHEADLPERYKDCKKYPGHKDFISLADLTIHCLPVGYQDEDLLELIKVHMKFGVRLKVKGNSEDRPLTFPDSQEPYPFSGRKYRKMLRCGSGWMSNISSFKESDNKPCECSTCRNSNEPVKRWAKITISTATHVVYDMTEGRNTVCYFFYDRDDLKIQDCISLSGAVEVSSFIKSDTSKLTYLTHDEKLINELRDAFETYCFLRGVVKDKYLKKGAQKDSSEVDWIRELELVSERCLYSISVLDELKGKLEGVFNGDIQQYWKDYVATHKEIDLHGIIIGDRITGGNYGETFLHEMSVQQETFREFMETNNSQIRTFRKLQLMAPTDYVKENIRLTCLARCAQAKDLDNQLKIFKNALYYHDMDDSTSPYDSDCTLCVIVSHPHGCSKKVTIGHIVRRELNSLGTESKYTYTNSTCPGSSGAQVFILGKMKSFWGDHPHSGAVGRLAHDSATLNESAFQQD